MSESKGAYSPLRKAQEENKSYKGILTNNYTS
jgi:hypothetical protein